MLALASNETLIVVAAYDDLYSHLTDQLEGRGGPVHRVSTADGGYQTQAIIDTYRFGPKHDSYLFLQDSLEPLVDDVVRPFREKQRSAKARSGMWPEVVAWGAFPMFFDSDQQKAWVGRQFPVLPPVGFFGPVFFAERKALDYLERFNLWPRVPRDKEQAQGTERSWAAAFFAAGVPFTALGGVEREAPDSPRVVPTDRTFRKVFGGRQ